MKSLIVLVIFVSGGVASANQSSIDIQSILADSKFQITLGEEEISSITNYGQRNYGFVYGKCSIQVSVLSNCLPTPGGPCVNEVRFDSSAVNCLP